MQMKEQTKRNWKPSLKGFIKVFSSIIIIIITVFWLGKTVESVASNWDIITFSISKPEMVRAIKLNYEEKVKLIEKQITTTEKTAEDKLIEEVVNQLKK